MNETNKTKNEFRDSFIIYFQMHECAKARRDVLVAALGPSGQSIQHLSELQTHCILAVGLRLITSQQGHRQIASW
jgi:hypothetical protein